ncbi:MAG: phage protein Gp27 family protein [Peptococcaceae bacterium]|nr:phage protein Gp27 family protein [Peptococcaceae bacterium]
MAKRQRTRVNSKIDQLPEELREKVDRMLFDPANTYEDIAAFLDGSGYSASKSAVGRYALRHNQASARVQETMAKTKAMAVAIAANPDLDFTKAGQVMLADGLMQRMAAAEEEWQEIPLDKAGRLIVSLGRAQLYEQAIRNNYQRKIDLAFAGLEDELMGVIKADPALAADLRAILQRAKDKVTNDDEAG